MAALWVCAALLALAGAYMLIDTRDVQATPSVATMSLAQSMAAYRFAALDYALAHPGASGTLASGALTPYLAAGMTNALWRVYVAPNVDTAGSTIVVYTTSTTAGQAIPAIEQLAFHSALAGATYQGRIVSPGNPAVALPAAVAALAPNGTPVWMAQAY